MARFRWLGGTWVLLSLLVATLAIMASFRPVQAAMDGPLLDFIFTGGAAEARLAELSEAQRRAHFWGTVVNDTAYPLAYGGLLAGLALRFGRGRDWLAWPAVLVIVADLAENTVQALALSGTANMLAAKTVLTPLKFGLFAVAALIAIYLVAWAIGAKIADMREKP
jgi:hypothetical protein